MLAYYVAGIFLISRQQLKDIEESDKGPQGLHRKRTACRAPKGRRGCRVLSPETLLGFLKGTGRFGWIDLHADNFK